MGRVGGVGGLLGEVPAGAPLCAGISAAARAHLLPLAQMATAMVSFGMLVALWVVCNAQMYRRYWPGTQMRFTQ